MVVVVAIIVVVEYVVVVANWVGGNRKQPLQSTNGDRKSLETMFLIVICCQSSDKWQLKTLFRTVFDLPFFSIAMMQSFATYPM